MSRRYIAYSKNQSNNENEGFRQTFEGIKSKKEVKEIIDEAGFDTKQIIIEKLSY